MKKNKFLYLFLLATTGILRGQVQPTATENYLYTKTCLNEDCSKKSEIVEYSDGLGRPKQVISIKGSPGGKDIVSPVEYDHFGRQVKNYLPIPQSGTQNGAVYADPKSNAPQTYGSDAYYYSLSLPENSPRSKLLSQTEPGADYAGHSIGFTEEVNTAADVKKYAVETSWQNNATKDVLTLEGNYPQGILRKNSVTDEDGNRSIEFINGKGQTVLVRKVLSSTQNSDTYYVYNKFNQLVYTIPPLAVNQPLSQTILDNLCYQYKYDPKGRQVEKKLPGKGWEYFVYDKADRLIMTQDANLGTTTKNSFSAKGWMFTKYDKFGRVTYTGFFPSEETRFSLQNQVNALTVNPENNEARISGSFTSDGMQVFYTQNAFPSAGIKVLTVNYYDTYPADSPARPSQIFGKPTIGDDLGQNLNTKNAPTASYVKNIEDNNWTKSYIWYDEKARAVGTHSVNHLGGYTKTESELDFAGVVKQSKVYHKRLSSDTETIITQIYEYDSQNRLKKQWHQVNSQPQELLAENTYNELSQLSNKKVGNNLQSIDYTYNIRGSVIKVNDPANLGTKLFGYELKYFNPLNTTASTGKYNGNIAEVTWTSATDGVKRRYNYQYDALNRLTKGLYSEPEATAPQDDFYNESVTYDMNSNILSLQRKGKNSLGLKSDIDLLTYVYNNNGNSNRLTSVTDDSHNYAGYPDVSGNTISYDDNGNMTNQIDKGILEIRYNVLNLPDYVKFDRTFIPRFDGDFNVNTQYVYRADGTKLRKTYTHGSGIHNSEASTITEYLDGFQYEMEDTGELLTSMTLKFVPTSEGYYNFENNQYIYSYKDHLGNIRLSYFNNGSSAEVLEENNFYPFGLKHEGYNALEGNPSYQYQYNGKELQQETGWSDYGARMYVSDIGRWGVIDPLAETGRRFSPYNYALNNPISFIDPDGRLTLSYENIMPTEGGDLPNGGFASYFAGGGGGLSSEMNDYFGTGNATMNVYQAMSAPSFMSNTVRWWTGSITRTDYRVGDEIHTDADFGILHSLTYSTENTAGIAALQTGNVVSGILNWIQGHPREFTSIAGSIEGSSQLAGWGIRNWNAPSSITKSRIFAEVISTRLPASAQALGKASNVLKWGGRAVGVIGLANTAYQWSEGNISDARATADAVMGVVGFFGPWGAAASLVYFGGMAIYETYYNDGKPAF